MSCCVNNLGRYSHNKEIDTFIVVSEDGTYDVHIEEASGNTFVLSKELDAGQTIKFLVGELNESMVHKFTIQKPDGSNLFVNDCDNFKLQTIINTQLDGCHDPCEDSDDTDGYYS